MNTDVMKANITKCLNMLPDGFINPQAVMTWVLAKKPVLEVLIPQMIDILKADFMALGSDLALGVADKDELERMAIMAIMESKHAAIDPALLAQMMSDGKNT